MTPLRVVFMGTPAIGIPTLQALIDDPSIEVCGVFCSPDKPVGRKQLLTPPPIKTLALSHHLPVYQPASLKGDDVYELIASLNADYFVVIAYGFLIPQRILDLPRFLPLNIHGSLLPKYRGASPIQESLLQGDTETGLTFMEMVKAMDAGPMLKKVVCPITPKETSETLFEKLSLLAGTNICSVLHDHAMGNLPPEEQNLSEVTTCSKITKEMGSITPESTSALRIYHMWQAYTPWPGISLLWKEEQLKLLSCTAHPEKTLTPGTWNVSSEGILFLGTKEGALEVSTLQRPGKKPMDASTFLTGYRAWLDLN